MTSRVSPFEDFLPVSKELQLVAVAKPLERQRTPVGQWVLKVREGAGLSQEKFATALRVGRTTVADWERGENFPELPHVLKMIELYPHAPQLPGQRLLENATAQSAAIAAMIAPLPEPLREQIQQVVKSMAVGLALPRKTAR